MNRFLGNLASSQSCVLALVLAIGAMTLCSGCSSMSADSSGGMRDFATTGLTTAAGGYIGAKAGNGKASDAALGAAAGFVAGEAINYFNDKAQREAYLAGYQKGQSNAIKQQYWIARDNQRAQTDDGYEESLYEIDVPETDQGGVHRDATTRVIRVVMPKQGGTP